MNSMFYVDEKVTEDWHDMRVRICVMVPVIWLRKLNKKDPGKDFLMLHDDHSKTEHVSIGLLLFIRIFIAILFESLN